MKTLLYTALTLIFVFSMACRSVEKMVEQGKYDEAILLAVKKLSGTKDKASKEVKALEKAFVKINQQDYAKIESLKSSPSSIRWNDVYQLATRINNRQNLVNPLLPLVSKEGYRAKIQLLDIDNQLEEARAQAARMYFTSAISKLDEAIQLSDKKLARDAIVDLKKVRQYDDQYPNLRENLLNAEDFATYHVLVRWDEASLLRIPGELNYLIKEPELNTLNSSWVRYYTSPASRQEFDIISHLVLTDVAVSAENQEVDRYTDKDRIERIIEERESVRADSTLVIEKTKEIIEVSADVELIKRRKNARLNVIVETRDALTRNLIIRDLIAANVNFFSEGGRFSGDRRALTSASLEQINKNLEPFPTDYQLMLDAIEVLHDQLNRHLQRLNLK